MKIRVHSKGVTGFKTPLMVVLAFEKKGGSEIPSSFSFSKTVRGDFKGKFRDVVLTYGGDRSVHQRILLVGLGPKGEVDAEKIRRAAAIANNKAKGLKVSQYSVYLGDAGFSNSHAETIGEAFAEGTVLASYSFDRFKSSAKSTKVSEQPKQANVFVAKSANAFQQGVKRGTVHAEAQCFARDLGNLPSNEKYPKWLATQCQKISRGSARIRCQVMDEKAMTRLGMGALLGVARGSKQPPRLAIMHYKPRKKAKKKIAVVGKGITFDTGGISIKPSSAMDEMKYDMCGSATVLGLFHGLAKLDVPYEIIGVAAFTENMPGGNAQKPGDIVKAYNGKTIEVLNTDAEGRLILADALSYIVAKQKPDAVIDFATLTGAIVHALGHEVSAVFTNNEKLSQSLCDAGEICGEKLWPMPILDVHRDAMKGSVGDLKNIAGGGIGGGACSAAGFLENFVDETPWCHLDIAGSAWGAKPKDYYSSGAFGVGVRLLLEFFRK